MLGAGKSIDPKTYTKPTKIIRINVIFTSGPLSLPIIELLFPSEKSFISTSNLSYSFSEELSLANANWEWLEGTRDTAQIHNVQLVNEELLGGEHLDTKFFDAPNLAEGGVYRLTLTGVDRAGNKATPIILDNLTFDATAPLFDDFTPILSSYINAPLIGYWLSENLKEGKLTESQVAKTILQQLGGNKFIAMTGAKNLGASNKSLSTLPLSLHLIGTMLSGLPASLLMRLPGASCWAAWPRA